MKVDDEGVIPPPARRLLRPHRLRPAHRLGAGRPRLRQGDPVRQDRGEVSGGRGSLRPAHTPPHPAPFRGHILNCRGQCILLLAIISIFAPPPAGQKPAVSDAGLPRYGFTHLSSGDLLREEVASGSERGTNYITNSHHEFDFQTCK
jgi:hypothetical protein